MTKYEEAFAKFDALTDAEIKTRIEDILAQDFDRYNTVEVKKAIYGLIDLTSLGGIDTEEDIVSLTREVNDSDGVDPTIPSVAAICVYPNFVRTVRETLTAGDVKVACVSGCFPASQSFIEIKLAETAMAIRDQTDEVDIVLNLGAFLSKDYQTASEEIQEQKATCGGATLKVIIESGALKTSEHIRQASVLALYSGADFIKTSTGKEYPGADFSAAYVMCSVLKKYYELFGERRGVKFSGGIRTPEDAVRYYCIVRAILGEEWIKPDLMRIGASSLAQNLREQIKG